MYTVIKPGSATPDTQDRPIQSFQNTTRTSATCESVPVPNPNPRDKTRRDKATRKAQQTSGKGEGGGIKHAT